MNEERVVAAARAALSAAQIDLTGDAVATVDLLAAITLAYGYVRGAFEASGVPDDVLDSQEEVGARLARRMASNRQARIREGMAQA